MIEIRKPAQAEKINYSPNPVFGTVFTPYTLKMMIQLDGKIPSGAEILPISNDGVPPTTAALHYGQSIFEGMKAFRQQDGSVGVFRADMHATRFRLSARRMVMAEVPEEIFLQCIREYVRFEEPNVPTDETHALYLRPLLFAAEPKIKVGTAQSYFFYIMSTIAGSYFSSSGQVRPARVLVNRQFVRAYPNGLGETKTAANYAASIWPQNLAAKHGCDQVLYLDAVEHKYVDELGGMNFFFIRGKELVTPRLNGCILRGVTRASILEMAADLGLVAKEEKVAFTDLCSAIESGEVQEAFACGTAAVVSPIGEFLAQDTIDDAPRSIKLPTGSSKSLEILAALSDIQRGKNTARKNWIFPC